MTLPTGAISMSQVAAELGISASGLDLNNGWVRQLAGQNSGTASMGNLRGQTAQPNWNGTPSSGGGPSLTMNMSVPFFRGVTSSCGGDAQTPISNFFLNFSSAPNWSGNIILRNNSTGGSITLVKRDSVTWWLQRGGSGPLRDSITDNFTLLPSN